MTSWKKISCTLLLPIVMSTISWAKPTLPETMHALNDSELSKITDHEHVDKASGSHAHEPPMEKKEVIQSLTKGDAIQKLYKTSTMNK
ncbi:hypothetical protein OHW32_11430 [Acinetobacter baumannii]|nr:hypothetical protein [Acinetobacter baumannii]